MISSITWLTFLREFILNMEVSGCCTITCLILFCTQVKGEFINDGWAITRYDPPTEYCASEFFNASCPPDSVIVMQWARFGRLQIGRCVRIDLGYLNCSSDILDHMHVRCTGRTTCEIKIPDDVMYEKRACPTDTTSHLRASYLCLQVQSDSGSKCPRQSHAELIQPEGFLSSLANAALNDAAGGVCLWKIRIAEGQKLNVTLYNFATLPSQSSQVCYDAATINNGMIHNLVQCSGDSGAKNIYIEAGNNIKLNMRTKSAGPFLIRYQVIGCPNLVAPIGGHVVRSGNVTVIKCDTSGDTWRLLCVGSVWSGIHGNCSNGGKFSDWNWMGTQTVFPYGILMVVAIGVALGVFCGGLLLGIASVYMKRNRRNQRRNPDHMTVPGGESLYEGNYGTGHAPRAGQFNVKDSQATGEETGLYDTMSRTRPEAADSGFDERKYFTDTMQSKRNKYHQYETPRFT